MIPLDKIVGLEEWLGKKIFGELPFDLLLEFRLTSQADAAVFFSHPLTLIVLATSFTYPGAWL